MTGKYTAGPWKTGKGYGMHGVEIVGNGGARKVCGVIGVDRDVRDKDGRLVELAQDHEGLANARLIAAAPELLEALIWMVQNDDTQVGDEPVDFLGGETWNQYNAYWIDGLNKARAAIAKATGSEP